MSPWTPPVMVISGFTFHPCCCRMAMRGSSFLCLVSMAMFGNWSSQYMNSMNWIVCVRDGFVGVWLAFGAPIIHRIIVLVLPCIGMYC